MNVYEKVKSMSLEELSEFLRVRFDSEQGSRASGIGCSGCIDFGTHHYPGDCGECTWLPVANNYSKWLGLDCETEQKEFEED